MTKVYPISDLNHAQGQKDFVFKGTACDVTGHRRSDIALVTFDNLASIDERPETGPWQPWLGKRADLLGYSLIGLQSHAKDWYRSSEAPDHIMTMLDSGYFEQFSRILFVGASMGGFAALNFASLVPGARVLAFSPQSTLNRDIAPFERRYPWPYRKFDWSAPAFLDAAQHTPELSGGHIFYDPHIPEDKLHAQRLTTPRVSAVTIPFADHTLIRTIAKAGALEHLIQRLAEHDTVDQRFWQLMRNRRKDPAWAKLFLQHLSNRGDGPLARRACRILHETHEHRFARRTLRQFKQSARARKAAKARMKEAPFWADQLPEETLRAKMPVFVAATTDVPALKETVAWFERNGFENVSIMTPPDLRKKQTESSQSTKAAPRMDPEEILALVFADPEAQNGFIFTDTDIELPDTPAADLVKTLVLTARNYALTKVGLALDLDPRHIDLDRRVEGKRPLEKSEKKNWKQKLEPGVFCADVDTSFFVYVPDALTITDPLKASINHKNLPSARIARPGFLARRRSWMRSATKGT